MKKFSKVLAVLLAVCMLVSLCPLGALADNTPSGTYKLEQVDGDTVKLTINSTDGFLVYKAVISTTTGTPDNFEVADYTLKSGSKLVGYTDPAVSKNTVGNNTTILVAATDAGTIALYTQVVITFDVTPGSNVALTNIQAADDGDVDTDATLLEFPGVDDASDGVIDTESQAYEEAAVVENVHTHNFTVASDVVVTPATCTAAAYYKAKCSVVGCDEVSDDATPIQSGDVDATNHTGTTGDWQFNENDHWKVWSCCSAEVDRVAHSGGIADHNNKAVCTVCSHQYGSTIAHTYDQTTVKDNTTLVSEKTCKDYAKYRKTCSCGAISSSDADIYEDVEGGKAAHAWDYSRNNDGTHNAVCTNACNCGETITNEACDTDGTDGACSKCGYKAAPTAVLDGNITFKTSLMQISDTLNLIFKAPKAVTIDTYDHCKAEFIAHKYDNSRNVYATDPIYVDLAGTTKNLDIIYKNIASVELDLSITCKILCYNAQDQLVAYSTVKEEIPVNLFKALYTASPTTQLQIATNRLVTDTLNLGAVAQAYFVTGYPSSDLSKATAMNSGWNQAYASTSLNVTDVSNYKWNDKSAITSETNKFSAQADVSGSPVVAFQLNRATPTGANPLDYSKLTMAVSYTSLYTESGHSELVTDVVTGDDWVQYESGKNLRYIFSKAKMFDSNKTISVALTYDGVTFLTASYSLDSFVFANSSNATMGGLVTQIGYFGQSARDYFTALGKTV